MIHYSNSFGMEEAFSIFPTLTFRLPSVFRISCLKASRKDPGTNGPALPFYGQARLSLTADLQRTMSKELVQSFRPSQVVLTERVSGNLSRDLSERLAVRGCLRVSPSWTWNDIRRRLVANSVIEDGVG